MTPTSPPLRDALREPFSEADLAALWPAVERRRDQRRHTARVGLVALTLVGASLAFAASVGLRREVSTARRAPGGPLMLAGGGAFTGIARAAHDPIARAAVFADRSRIALDAGATVAARHNDAHTFVTQLEHGRVRFDVTPRGPRRWTIECGLATVHVVGTSFVLDRTPSRLHVAVLHGRVRVEGARVPGHTRLLRDGESLDVTAAPPPSPPAPLAPVAAVAPAPPNPRVRAPQERWRSLAAQHDFARAYDALGPGGAASRARGASADELLSLGEVAHRSRHYQEAAALYGRFVSAHGAHAQCPMVAFTLGRLQLDQLGAPDEAARSFETALRLGLPRDLQEDAYARRVEAFARAGDTTRAAEAADAYLERFSNGRRADDVRRWTHR
jgi:transmembrane sensor